MATTRPPNAPPNPPGFDDYRPSDERTNPPSQSAVQQRQPSPQLQAQWGPYAQHYQNEQAQDPRFAQSNAPPQNPYPQAPPQHYQPQQPYAQPPQGMPPQQRRAGPPGGGGKPPRKPAPPPRRGIFGKIMLGLVVLALLVGGAAAYLILNAPADLVRDRIVAEVKAKTGRDLTITGRFAVAAAGHDRSAAGDHGELRRLGAHSAADEARGLRRAHHSQEASV
jgi:hypothetical protein